jgi:hypothetical protein
LGPNVHFHITELPPVKLGKMTLSVSVAPDMTLHDLQWKEAELFSDGRRQVKLGTRGLEVPCLERLPKSNQSVTCHCYNRDGPMFLETKDL